MILRWPQARVGLSCRVRSAVHRGRQNHKLASEDTERMRRLLTRILQESFMILSILGMC